MDLVLSRCFSGIQPGFPADAQTGRFTAPMYLFLFQNLLYFLALQVGKWRTGDRDGAKSLLLYVLLLVVFLLAFGLLLWRMGL